jgi:hypothetical protein
MKIYYLDMESWSQLIYDHLLRRQHQADQTVPASAALGDEQA